MNHVAIKIIMLREIRQKNTVYFIENSRNFKLLLSTESRFMVLWGMGVEQGGTSKG